MQTFRWLLAALLAFTPAAAQNINTGNGASTPDPYILTNLIPLGHGNGYSDTKGRTLLSPVKSVNRRLVVFTPGQSNNGNPGATTTHFTPVNNVRNLDIFNGGLYTAKDPLLGGDGPGGAWSLRTSDQLITDDYFDEVDIVSLAIGDTLVADWAPGGFLNQRIGVAVKRMLAANLQPTRCMIWWDQGESDNLAGTTQDAYAASLSGVISTFTDNGINCPFFIAQASWVNTVVSAPVRAAQIGAVNNTTTFFLGDFDTIDCTGRESGCIDFNTTGVIAAGGIALVKVEAYLDAHP